MASTTLTQTQTTVNVATIHGCLESPHLKPPPEIMVAPEAAKTCQSGHVSFHIGLFQYRLRLKFTLAELNAFAIVDLYVNQEITCPFYNICHLP